MGTGGEQKTTPQSSAKQRAVRSAGKTSGGMAHAPGKTITIADVGPEVTCYECMVCGFIYDPLVGDPVGGIPPGENFLSLPYDWICPECSSGKNQFAPVQL
jgi:rubredoxin